MAGLPQLLSALSVQCMVAPRTHPTSYDLIVAEVYIFSNRKRGAVQNCILHTQFCHRSFVIVSADRYGRERQVDCIGFPHIIRDAGVVLQAATTAAIAAGRHS